MGFRIGQKVSYPNHGVCSIESIDSKQIAGSSVEFYSLRLLSNNSIIFVPRNNAQTVGIRPIINSVQCSEVLQFLAEDFAEIVNDWKIRIRDFTAQIQTGNIFEVSDALKKLTFLTTFKQLSFREQRLFEKAKFLVVSELATVCSQTECETEERVDKCLAIACEKHKGEDAELVSSAAH
jgi:CarD family transcriptional regulator